MKIEATVNLDNGQHIVVITELCTEKELQSFLINFSIAGILDRTNKKYYPPHRIVDVDFVSNMVI